VGDVPPLVGVAAKLTLVPEHMDEPGLAAMPTLTGDSAVTLMVTEFDVAGEPETQLRLEVIVQVIISPSASDADA